MSPAHRQPAAGSPGSMMRGRTAGAPTITGNFLCPQDWALAGLES